jgi:NAD(P)-binding Rossmann-like domain
MTGLVAHSDDIFAQLGRYYITQHVSGSEKREVLLPLPPRAVTDDVSVGILGAGVGGLYTALMLQSLDVNYEIIEASNRTGGRLFTHKFADGGPYDYFVSFKSLWVIGRYLISLLQDVGAMRYPLPPVDDQGNYQPGVMQRLGWLFNYIGLEDKLIPYYYTSDRSPGLEYYNGIRAHVGDKNDFDAPALGINESYIAAGTSAIVADVLHPFALALYDDLVNHTTTGWEKMLSADAHSTRSYMTFAYNPSPSLGIPEQSLSTDVVNWLETFDKSTGWYDRGLTETVLEAIAFGQAGDGTVDWKCIEYVRHFSPCGSHADDVIVYSAEGRMFFPILWWKKLRIKQAKMSSN